jgi:peptidoglycan/xylan/chitin deacetylase (PgdA/CDA1 family)
VSLARSAIKPIAGAVDRLHCPPPGVVVLLYHQVGGPRPGEVDLPVAAFADQMAELAATTDVLTLDAAIDRLVDSGPVPPPPDRPQVVLTFDDGTADFVGHALPVLVEHRLPVTLYAATRWIDEGRSFWDDGTVLSWSALADAHATGLLTVGSHTHSHLLLDRVPREEAAADLDRSIGLVEDHLGVTPHHFAYPKALAPSPANELEVLDRFRSAALARTRPNPYGRTNPYRLTRSPIQVSDGMRWFRAKVAGGMWLEDRVRDLRNRRRYAGVTR